VASALETLYARSDGLPDAAARAALASATGLSRQQIRNWFTNARSRRNTPGRR
jgi:hypothetical protein